jgi:hypothetical protein
MAQRRELNCRALAFPARLEPRDEIDLSACIPTMESWWRVGDQLEGGSCVDARRDSVIVVAIYRYDQRLSGSYI